MSYLRSSAYSSWDLCEMQFFFDYVLGWRAPSGKAADTGNIVHKALELLARKKLAMQNSEPTFEEPECAPGRAFDTQALTAAEALQVAWDHYTLGPAKHHIWKPADRKQVAKLVDVVLFENDGAFNPLNRNVLAPEQFFDFTLTEPWSKFSYTDKNGKVVEGNLGLRGTVDLVTKVRDNPLVIEYIDWKTGRRWCWAKDREKTQATLQDDFQLMLYHYALSRLYPTAQSIIMTIHFIKDGGPFTITFEKKDLDRTMELIKKRFEEIKAKRIPRQSRSYKCTSFCHFGKTLWRDQKFADVNLIKNQDHRTVCHTLHKEVVSLGLDRVIARYGKSDALSSYTGGGKQDVKSPNA